MFSLIFKENPKFSKSFIADLKEENGVEGWGKSSSSVPSIGWV